MSYRVEFTRTVFALPGGIYALASFGGDNNLTTTRGGSERIACRWSLEHIGDEVSLMQHTCRVAGGCEDGWIKPRGRYVTAEGYIRGTRDMLKEAPKFPEQCGRTHARLSNRLTLAVEQPILEGNSEAKVIFALLGGLPAIHYGTAEIHAYVDIDEELPGTLSKLRGLLGKDLRVRGSVNSPNYQNDW